MRYILTITVLLFSLSRVLAHEEGPEITNLAQADWTSPIIAVIIIAGAIVIARIVRKKPSRQIINDKTAN